MIAPLSHESSADRFAAYVKELRELFLSYGMKTGEAKDILPLASRLTDAGPIYDDITSILRSIIYREHESIPRPELLRLILTAVAGPPVLDRSDQVQHAIVQLESYVGEVMASLRKGAFADDPHESDESQEPQESEEAHVSQEHQEPASLPKQLPAVEVYAVPPIPPRPKIEEAREVRPSDDLEPEGAVTPLPRPNLQAPHFADPTPVEAPAAFPAESRLEMQPVSSLLPLRANEPLTSRRSAWVIGIAAMLPIALAGIFWRHNFPVQPVPSTMSSPVVASARALHSEPPPDVGPNTAEHPSATAPEFRNSRPVSADRALPSTPGASTFPLVPPAIPTRPPQSPSQPSASSTSQVPSQPVARRQGRARPNAPRQAVAPASVPTGTAKQPSGKSASFLVSSGVMDGNLVTIPTTPNYPKMANMAGVEGKVILQAVISRNGNVVATHVLDGHRLLRGAAAHAVRGWRYRPYLVHGKPTDVATIVIVDFHLPH